MKNILALSLLSLAATGAMALPLDEVTIFSSGVAYFEHEGKVSGSYSFSLSFEEEQLNDFLKSVAMSDGGAKKITLNYSSSDALEKTLSSLPVDLSSRPSIDQFLRTQIGSEVHFSVMQGAETISVDGRILSVDNRDASDKSGSRDETRISVLTADGVRVFMLSDAVRFTFQNPEKTDALIKALQLLDTENSSRKKKTVTINVEGAGDRTVKLSYVLGAPVWKTTYRLVLGNESAIFQAWAIVDNSTDLDWNAIKLHLITGKPVSFRQNLYEPYYVARPLVELPIEGAAELEMYDEAEICEEAQLAAPESPRYYNGAPALKSRTTGSYGGSSIELKEEVFSGEASLQADNKFVFTPKDPVSLARQKSVMLPLKVTTLPVKKMTVFSDLGSESKHPKQCVELTNNSGMNLPAGAITLYDEGYSGDSMITFLPKDEKRLISYGDDLLMSGRRSNKTDETITTVSAADGVLKTEVERRYIASYRFTNSDTKNHTIMLEHPITPNTVLFDSQAPIEKTADNYRFQVELPSRKTTGFTVTEKRTLFHKYRLLDTLDKTVLAYVSSKEAPQRVKDIFATIANERKKIEVLSAELATLETSVKKLNADQERTRKNMEALAKTNEGGSFTQKLLELEGKIVAANEAIDKKQAELEKQKTAFNTYIESIAF